MAHRSATLALRTAFRCLFQLVHRFLDFPEDDSSNEPDRQHFNVFTDPIEMHRYFEQQMDQVFRTFGLPNFGNFFHQTRTIDSYLTEEDLHQESGDPRENFLKKEYVKPHYEESGEKMDRDIDGKLNLGDLDSIFKGARNNHSLDIYREPKPFGGTLFSQSVQVKTIRKPDGSVETRKTVRDSQGNEEITITQQLGDKEYTIVKKFDKDGREETEELMKNMNENDKAVFQKREHNDTEHSGPYFNNSLFNKFFK